MTAAITIRQVLKDDLKQISQMEEETFKPNHYPLFVLRQFYDISPKLFVVAANNVNHIKAYGFGGIDHDNNIGWIFAIAVHKHAQNKKIGQRITTELIHAFKNKNIKTIQLTTTPDNSPAIHLYEKLGFKKIEKVANYYGDNTPRIIMRLDMN